MLMLLTHRSRVTRTRVSKLTIIGSDIGLPPGQRQALLETMLESNFSEFLLEIHIFSFEKMHLKMSSGKWRPFCLGLNVYGWCISVLNTSYGKLITFCAYPRNHAHNFHIHHDEVIKWKHFPRYWPFVRKIHRSPMNFPHKGQWRGALMFALICVWINGWVNNREAGDLRRNRAHYDVIVMIIWPSQVFRNTTYRDSHHKDNLMEYLIRPHCYIETATRFFAISC